ncbi:unnamed protein product, partial [Rotaria sp. Silwood1]
MDGGQVSLNNDQNNLKDYYSMEVDQISAAINSLLDNNRVHS